MKVNAFLASCLLAFIAGHMVNYAVIFLALEWFDSHAIAGIGYGLCFGPPVILGWFAGVFCDRYSPRRVLLIAQNSFLISIAILAFALYSDENTQLTLLLLAAFCSGIGWSFVAPARFSLLPYYLKQQQLAGATITLNLMVMTGFGLAPLILKTLQTQYGWLFVFQIAAVLFITSSAIVLYLRIQFLPNASKHYIKEILRTFTVIRQSEMLLPLMLLAVIAYLLMGPMQVLLPTIAEQTLKLSPTSQGRYLSLIALGLIVGGILAMLVKDKGKIGVNTMMALLMSGACLGMLGDITSLKTSITILLIAGICGGIAVSFIVASIQHFSHDEYRGRIMSVYTIVGQFIPALSGVLAGVLADVFSPKTALSIMAFIIAVAVLSCLALSKNLRQFHGFSHA